MCEVILCVCLCCLHVEVPNESALCEALANSKATSWEEIHDILVTRSKLNGCMKSVSDKLIAKVTNGITSNKLSQVYFATDSAIALANKGTLICFFFVLIYSFH